MMHVLEELPIQFPIFNKLAGLVWGSGEHGDTQGSIEHSLEFRLTLHFDNALVSWPLERNVKLIVARLGEGVPSQELLDVSVVVVGKLTAHVTVGLSSPLLVVVAKHNQGRVVSDVETIDYFAGQIRDNAELLLQDGTSRVR